MIEHCYVPNQYPYLKLYNVTLYLIRGNEIFNIFISWLWQHDAKPTGVLTLGSQVTAVYPAIQRETKKKNTINLYESVASPASAV